MENTKPSGGGVVVTKSQAIQILKRQIENKIMSLPFNIMSFEYGKDSCSDCEDCGESECICRNGIETDDIEILQEDSENYYENFELWF